MEQFKSLLGKIGTIGWAIIGTAAFFIIFGLVLYLIPASPPEPASGVGTVGTLQCENGGSRVPLWDDLESSSAFAFADAGTRATLRGEPRQIDGGEFQRVRIEEYGVQTIWVPTECVQ